MTGAAGRRGRPWSKQAVVDLEAAVRGMTNAVRRLRGRETHRREQLSFAQFGLLFALSGYEELSASELAQAAELTPATVTQILDAVVELGLVQRTRAESDRRIVTCKLTEVGRTLVHDRRKRWEALWTRALADFSTDELTAATAVLARLQILFDQVSESAA